MKQSDITPKIIDLSKRIAEKWRMEIYEGCWGILPNDNKLFLITEKIKGISHNGFRAIYPILPSFGKTTLMASDHIPIPSIEDVLSRLVQLEGATAKYILAKRCDDVLLGHITVTEFHEALLEALLAVLEEK